MIEYTLERKKGRRTLGIYIQNNGKVVVRVPFYTSEERINKLLSDKEQWIEEKCARKKSQLKLLPSFKKGSVVWIAGEYYRIDYNDGKRAILKDNVLFLPEKNSEKALTLFVRKKFLPYITERTNYFAHLFGFSCGSVSVGIAHKKWGSCTLKNDIRYSLSMAFLPEYLSDYVVVHELCHTLEKNHQKGFYSLMDRVMPDHRKRSKDLKSYSAYTEILKP